MKYIKTFMFYFLQFTWGIVMNIAGFFTLLTAWIIGEKIGYCDKHIYIYSRYCHNAAFSLGIFIIMGEDCESCAPHEAGHGLQNIMFGPLMPFIVSIPSVIRFWYREYAARNGKVLLPYDSIWFEGMATNLGKKYYPNLGKEIYNKANQ